MTAMDWRHRASCRDEDPELFFPISTTGPSLVQVAKAKTVCRACPVQAECLRWALESGEEGGIWGGFTEDERRARRRQAAERDGSDPGVPSVPDRPAMLPEPDRVVVGRLMVAGAGAVDATAEEVALAAVALLERGWAQARVAEHLKVTEARVREWLTRASAGAALVQGRETGAARRIA